MPRLPSVGADGDAWGDILNDYLRAEHQPDGTHNFGIFNVLTFGAKGDGVTDDTAAIQAALDAAGSVGGVVWLTPVAKPYRCEGSLTVPPHVTLKGGYGGMRRGLKLHTEEAGPRGSVLYVCTTADFITMSHNSILDGIEIFYPNQVTAGTPNAHGWTIKIPRHQHGVTIRNIACPNPYQLIEVNADGVLIEAVQGYPLAVGIKLSRVADVPRINNIHFNPNVWKEAAESLCQWVQTTGFCLEVVRAEELMVTNFFGFGYLRGIWFREYVPEPDEPEFPGSYGSITNFGFDYVQEGILVQTKGISNRQGFSLSNGRVVPLGGAVGSRTGIKFADTLPSEGPGFSMSNVSFFGEHKRSIWIESGSKARVTIMGGQSTEYTDQMVLCESSTAIVRLVAVRSFRGSDVRINNPGEGDVTDTMPMVS